MTPSSTADEAPGGWERPIGRPPEDDDRTYTHRTVNWEWGDAARENVDWEEIQKMTDADAEAFVREWLDGEWPDRYDEYPQHLELDVYHDAGHRHHWVALYECQHYPDTHPHHPDTVDEGYPRAWKFDTAAAAHEKAREIMTEHQ